MARAQTARQDGITVSASGRNQPFSVKILGKCLSEKTLRRFIPYLLALFYLTLLAGTLGHFIYGKQVAFDDARSRLSLIADTIAANLQNADLATSGDWQAALADNLPGGSTIDERRVLLADADGAIRATAPFKPTRTRTTLLQIIGKNQPVTTFGAQAGVLELALPNGQDTLVTLRSVAGTGAQLALIQPTDTALASWRREAAVDTTLSLTAGFVLLLIGASFRWLSERANAAETMLADGQSDLYTALERAGLGIIDWNLSTGQLRVSRTIRTMLGSDSDSDVIQTGRLAELIHPDDDLCGAVRDAAGNPRCYFAHPFRVRREDGHFLQLNFEGTFSTDKQTGEEHLVAVASPATLHATGSVGAKGDVRLRDAIEAISEAFVLWDEQNRLVMCNGKYKQFYRLDDKIARPGMPYEDVIARATAPVVLTRTVMNEGDTSGALTYEAQLKDGSWLHIDERRTKDGGFVSVGTDITSLKQSQQRQQKSEEELKATISDLRISRRELEQQKQQLVDLMEKYALEKNRAEAANQAKSEFLANISHELRTPLNAVIGFSEVMENGLFGPVGNKKYVEYARDIHQSGKYLLEVINDVLDMSKIEAGRMILEIADVDAGDIIMDSIRVVSPVANERSIGVKSAGLKKLEMQADRRALKQILLNLLSNAVKFTPKSGQVTVHLTKLKGQAKIAISDTGIGIPEPELGKLGRPFEQVENQFTKSHGGSGLGLAISRSLVELHGGKFEITSDPGKGTTVVCHLPLKPVLMSESAAA